MNTLGDGSRKKPQDNIDSYLDTLLLICDLTAYFWVPEGLSWKTFLALIAVLVIWGIGIISNGFKAFFRLKKKYKTEKRKVFQRAKKDVEFRSGEYSFSQDKLENEYFELLKRAIKPKVIKIAMLVWLIVAICRQNPEKFEALGRWLGYDPTAQVKEEEMIVERESEKSEQKDLDVPDYDEDMEEREKKDPAYNFVLIHPDKEQELGKEEESQIYFWYSGLYEGELEETIRNTLSEFRASKKENANLEEVPKKMGLTFSSLEKDETDFKNAVKECKNIEYQDDWEREAPDSDDLEDYMVGRERLNSMLIDGNQGCYTLCWRLANDYQYYAIEYETQTENAQAIYYCYSMSIYYCMEALKYDITDSQRADTENYMISRYEDLSRSDCIVAEEYKERAADIAEILRNIL